MMNKSLTSTKMIGGSTKKWSRIKYPESYIRYLIWLGTILFLTFSIEYLDIPLERLMGMLERMGYTLSNRYYPPDIEYIMDLDYMEYVVETIQMAYLATLFGLLMTLPLGWFGSYNLTPSRRFIFPIARLITCLLYTSPSPRDRG